jgi:quinoprotein glucose dehydrogenase
MMAPGTQGGANWPGGSYDPETNTIYVYSKSVMETIAASEIQGEPGNYRTQLGQTSGFNETGGGGFGGAASINGPAPARVRFSGSDAMDAPIVPGLLTIAGLPILKPPYGRITAIDMNNGTIKWQVAHGETPDAIRNHPLLKGVRIPRTGQASILGTLTTKTLIVCGDGGLFTDEKGRKGARLRAYDKATGEEKGAVFIPWVQTGAAMTYMLGGKQYIVTAIGGSYGAALVAFRLPDNA